MKAILLACLMASGTASRLMAQNSAIPPIIRTQSTVDILALSGITSNTINYGIPQQPGKLIGDGYLNKTWNKTTILMVDRDRLLEGYLTRLNLQEQTLEIKASNGIRVLSVEKIKSMVWIDSITAQPNFFVAGSDFKFDNNPVSGLLEVLVDGKVSLLKQTTVHIKKSTYNAALDVGSRDDKIISKTRYFLTQENGLVLVKNKKDLLKKIPALNELLESNKLDLDNQQDLITLCKQLNK